MKVIFLDIDGVLNTSNTFIRVYFEKQTAKEYILDIDEEKVKLLSEICHETGAKIVISSSWRTFWENGKENLKDIKAIKLQELFDKYDIEIVGIT